ncbi:fungal-specific transcription factor domain-containing protein [Xylogone sp. PMI_703]|nr:fungal-specific transcription factor domain-containing protein [Xylogone sp. PMI_703]
MEEVGLELDKNESGDASQLRSRPTTSLPGSSPAQQAARQRSQGFQFVNLRGAPRRNAATRKLVKAHVARHVLSRQRSTTSAESVDNEKEIDIKEEYEDGIIPEQPVWPPMNIYTMELESNLLDPFGPIPIPNGPFVQDLIKHYGTVFAFSLCPLGGKLPLVAELYPVATTDAMLFHALLSVAAAHQSCLLGRRTPSAREMMHRGQAIHMLNQKLALGNISFDDSIIATILLLGAHDVLFGDIAAIESHIQGLELMIRSRGGVRTLGMEGALSDLLYWIDHTCALFTASKPRFPLVAPGSILKKERFRIDYSLRWAVPIHSSGFGSLVTQGMISKEFARLLELMFYLSNRTWEALVAGIRNREPCRFHDTRAHIDEILHAAKDYTVGSSGTAEIQECIRLAASIYSNICFRDIPAASAIHSHLVDQLQLALVKSKLSSTWTGHLDVLIWILFMGGAVITDEGCRFWILGLLKPACDQLGLTDWESVRETLRKFLWLDIFCEGPCKKVWAQMMQQQPSDLIL